MSLGSLRHDAASPLYPLPVPTSGKPLRFLLKSRPFPLSVWTLCRGRVFGASACCPLSPILPGRAFFWNIFVPFSFFQPRFFFDRFYIYFLPFPAVTGDPRLGIPVVGSSLSPFDCFFPGLNLARLLPDWVEGLSVSDFFSQSNREFPSTSPLAMFRFSISK